MRGKTFAACLVAALAGYLASGATGYAQSLDDKLRAELTAVLAQLHELQNNQATLEAAKASAERERDALKAKLARGGGGPARAVSPAVQAALSDEKAKTSQLTDQLQAAQAESAKYKDAYAQAAQAAQAATAERDRLALQVTAGAAALGDCQTKNIELLRIGRELMSAYEHVGVGQAMARGEPLLGLERAKMERIAEAYGDRLYSAKFDPRAVKPAGAAASATR
jgi:hypothetical protein